jgi:hypothetical protein
MMKAIFIYILFNSCILVSAGCINNQEKIELANCNCGSPSIPPPPSYWDDDDEGGPTKQSSVINYIEKHVDDHHSKQFIPVLDSFTMLGNDGTLWTVHYYIQQYHPGARFVTRKKRWHHKSRERIIPL